MEKYEKQVTQAQLNREKAVLKKLEKTYSDALIEIDAKIAELLGRSDADMQHVIFQVQYQQALKAQTQAILETLHTNEFTSISDYLTQSYTDGFLGTLYSMQEQGVPFVFPIDQKQVVDAIQHQTMLKESLYKTLGVDIKSLQKVIAGEISRGIVSGATLNEISKSISRHARIPLNRAMTIARTESHRISETAQYDVQKMAKSKGADIVKVWSATLDGKTRQHHFELDGQIRELEEPFEVAGMKVMRPGQFGTAAEDCNCRCFSRTKARWLLDEESTKMLENTSNMSPERRKAVAEKLGIDESQLDEYSGQIVPLNAKDYDDFVKKYDKIWNFKGSDLEKEANERIAGYSQRVRLSAQKIKDGEGTAYYGGGIPKNWKTIDASKDNAILNANPNREKEGYDTNCPNCACAYELRKRGHDVVARPYVQGGSHYLNANPWEAWENTKPSKEKHSLAEMMAYVEEFEDGSRFGIAYTRKRKGGHVIVGEYIDNKLTLYDPQKGVQIEGLDFDSISGVKLWQTNGKTLSDRGRTACESR